MQALSAFFMLITLAALGFLVAVCGVAFVSSGSVFLGALAICNAAGLVALGLLFALGDN